MREKLNVGAAIPMKAPASQLNSNSNVAAVAPADVVMAQNADLFRWCGQCTCTEEIANYVALVSQNSLS